MYCVRKMTEDLYWVGASERRLSLFENAYPLTNGVSYNSYLVEGSEKTALIDGVENTEISGLVAHIRARETGAALHYLVVNHMEPDHSGAIPALLRICLLYTSDAADD